MLVISGSPEEVAVCRDLLKARITPREDGGMAGPEVSDSNRGIHSVREQEREGEGERAKQSKRSPREREREKKKAGLTEKDRE